MTAPIGFVVLGHLAIAAATHVLVRNVLKTEGVPPEVVVAARCAVAVLVLLPLFRAGGVAAPYGRRDVLRLLAVAALAVPVNQLCYIGGLQRTDAVHGALLFCLSPLCVGVLSACLEGVRTPRGAWLGAATAALGVGVVLWQSVEISEEKLHGDLVLLGAVAAWSLVTVLSRPLLAKTPSFQLSRRILLVGAALLAPWVAGPVAEYDWAGASARSWAVFVFLGVCTSVVSYVLWHVMLRRLGALRCAVFINLQPPVVGLLAWPVNDERPTWGLVVGGVLVILGVLQTQRAVGRAGADEILAADDDPPIAG